MSETKAFTTYKELLDYLHPGATHWDIPRFDVHTQHGWIFRGQRDSSWTLQPSAFRNGAFERLIDWWTPAHNFTMPHYVEYHSMAEVSAVRLFIRISDSLGIQTPLRHDTNRELAKLANDFNRVLTNHTPMATTLPPHNLKEAFGLAQHHGIPTRLLDWTYNSYTALFFAAHGAWKNRSEWKADSAIAVWVLNYKEMEFEDVEISRIQMLYAPYANNSFLRSQAGLFTYDKDANALAVANNRWQTQDEVINSLLRFDKQHLFKKLILPVSEVKPLLLALYKMKISKVHLMPTLDNVKETIIDTNEFK